MKRKTSNLKNTLGIMVLLCFVMTCKPEQKTSDASVIEDTTWAMLPFVKVDGVNPILGPGENVFHCPILDQKVKWDEKDVFNPAAVVRDGKVYMIFRAEDKIGKYAGTSRLGLAVSDDGLNFTKSKEPVFFPDNDSLKIFEWEGGVEDPRIVETAEGNYLMTYTAYDGKVARLLLATSRDLTHWKKLGTVLQGKYKNAWSKSGAIISEKQGSRIVATKIKGKYWMYFGDTDLFLASSEDLLHWEPMEENGKLKSVLQPRPGFFDSRLVESGPYALVNEEGVLLIYNSMNHDSVGDPSLPKGAYAVGQVLFDKNDPTKIVKRLTKNFMRPDRPYETTGQINQVCFAEGLVFFKEKWFLYYGTADSKIAVAIRE